MWIWPFLKLIRIENLLMILLTQFLIKYFLFEPFKIDITLNAFGFFLLSLSTICIAAGGNIINDIYDQKIDAINKPEKQVVGQVISERAATNWFLALNIIGVGIGFYLANLVGEPSFPALFIFPSALLYLYASYLKGTIILGNMLVSLLVALVIIIMGVFDLYPAITSENRTTQKVIFSILLDYAVFAFLVNFLREMVKDQEDIKGDYNAKMQTLPVLLGRNRCNKIIFCLTILPLAGVVYYIYFYLYENLWAVLYALLLILAPLLVFWVKIFNAETKKEFSRLSLLLKMVLTAGLLSIGLYRFILL